MDSIAVIGLVAGALTTVAFLPQLIKAWKSRSTNDISILMYIVFCTGVALWLIYGFFIGSLPVILANIATLIIAIAILIIKIRFH